MINSLIVAFLLSSAPADSVQYYYAHRDVDSLLSLCDSFESRSEDLLCRYRLYPLTGDKQLLKKIPDRLSEPSARELALLSGLWGFRAAHGSVFDMVRFGRRSHRLLEVAKRLEPDNPIVLLIEGQSLLFRPGIFGGDAQQALLVFRKLQRTVSQSSDSVVSEMEADLWTWLALSKLGDSSADRLKEHILSQSPPPLYADFVENPPG